MLYVGDAYVVGVGVCVGGDLSVGVAVGGDAVIAVVVDAVDIVVDVGGCVRDVVANVVGGVRCSSYGDDGGVRGCVVVVFGGVVGFPGAVVIGVYIATRVVGVTSVAAVLCYADGDMDTGVCVVGVVVYDWCV